MPVRQDLTIRQGTTWQQVFTKLDADGDPVDLTGYTARMHVAETVGGAQSLAYLSTGADSRGGLIDVSDEGEVTVSMSPTQTRGLVTSSIPASFREVAEARLREATLTVVYALDLETPEGVITREWEGRIIIYREV